MVYHASNENRISKFQDAKIWASGRSDTSSISGKVILSFLPKNRPS
ncbi:hypothetical protein C5167_027390 [Papaver somniferum]|nr:hypothetical protein C5167_027390 [Papaver somniferum]